MRGPHLWIARGTPATGRQERTQVGRELGLDEQFGKGRVCRIVGLPRQRKLGVRCYFNITRAAAVIGDRDTADLAVIFRRHGNFQSRCDRAVCACDFRPVLGKYDLVAVGLGYARLIAS